ncbi:MAG: hypothetical protein HQ483_16930 [Rhodospirillales bacterium]|nr:hypothetical protein [Rhodospirillales bacterium]
MVSELTLSQLICSRVCHDLVGAAGAVNAGVELLGEDPSDMAAPLELMATSAQQLTRRLAFFRFVFGSAGGPDSPFAADQIKTLLEDFVADKKLKLVWDSLNMADAAPAQQSACGKLLSAMLLIAIDCLPRGGDARIHVGPVDGGMAVAIEASGSSVRFPEDIDIAVHLQQVNDQLSARNVHAYVAAQLAKSVNGSLEIEVVDGAVQIACVMSDR